MELLVYLTDKSYSKLRYPAIDANTFPQYFCKTRNPANVIHVTP